MAQVKEKQVRKPWGKNNIICNNCDAEYNPKTKFAMYLIPEGTSGAMQKLYDIPMNQCPLCRK